MMKKSRKKLNLEKANISVYNWIEIIRLSELVISIKRIQETKVESLGEMCNNTEQIEIKTLMKISHDVEHKTEEEKT